MIQHAKGTFQVSMTLPASPEERAVGLLGRMLLDKQYAGDLAADSQGQMLTAMTATQGSAGYVAIELVTGTLHGRAGSFALQHSGTMDRGAPLLLVTVVPDSGTDALEGISGQLTIRVAEGKHFYALDYTLPA
jgi:Protein of unknown function (DUF3224)